MSDDMSKEVVTGWRPIVPGGEDKKPEEIKNSPLGNELEQPKPVQPREVSGWTPLISDKEVQDRTKGLLQRTGRDEDAARIGGQGQTDGEKDFNSFKGMWNSPIPADRKAAEQWYAGRAMQMSDSERKRFQDVMAASPAQGHEVGGGLGQGGGGNRTINTQPIEHRGPERKFSPDELKELRKEINEFLSDRLFIEGASIEPVAQQELTSVLGALKLPNGISQEARNNFFQECRAYTVLMNLSAAKHFFGDKAGSFYRSAEDLDKETYSGLAKKWKEYFVSNYKDQQWTALLENKSGGLDISKMSKVLGQLKYDSSNGTGSWFSDLIANNGVVDVESEKRLVAELAMRFGCSEYEARIAHSIYEALVEPEVNSRHFLWALTHSDKWATTMKEAIKVWIGSREWWKKWLTNGERSCSLPSRLWKAPVEEDDKLRVEIEAGRGVEAMLDRINNPSDRGKDFMDETISSIKGASGTLEKIMLLGPSTEMEKFSADMIWSIKKGLKEAARKKYLSDEEARRVLGDTVRVFFREMSAQSPFANKSEKGGKRMAAPGFIFQKFVEVFTIDNLNNDSGDEWEPKIVNGKFVTKDGEIVKEKVKKYYDDGKILNFKGKAAFGVDRVYRDVVEYIGHFYHNYSSATSPRQNSPDYRGAYLYVGRIFGLESFSLGVGGIRGLLPRGYVDKGRANKLRTEEAKLGT